MIFLKYSGRYQRKLINAESSDRNLAYMCLAFRYICTQEGL